MSPGTRLLAPKPTLTWSEVGPEVVILNRTGRELLRLNPVGGFIWKQLDGQRSSPEIVQAVCQAFATDEASAAKDVQSFMDHLKALELVEEKFGESGDRSQHP